ncbi:MULTISPECIES: patatin-like phospholipase family protein [Clostridium]|uniref:Patatin-like phospholipase family protein n=1 Tax=Clostridium cibarium TaxID=2762247 RepID=A0ABR8PTJ6_9CLOT|nr:MULTISPECIES: patatin-like phospholipase family protein [Clostridium]MBD7911496.1 patatin-like phospholipase family protein [Clostridium cibarium]
MSTFRIISFDGGGVKGALSTSLLKRLCTDNPTLVDKTALFAGTSSGGLISLGLAAGLNSDEVNNLFSYENAKNVFTPKRINLFHPRFKNRNLKKLMSSIISYDKTALGDLDKYVFIPSFNVKGVSRNHWQGVFFNNLSKKYHCNEKILDVALATSAAPTYFPSHNNYIDGGIITNSPAIASVITVIHKFPEYNLKDFRVLSIGTGSSPKKISENTKNWGILNWTLRPFSTVKLPLVSVLLNDAVPLENLYSKTLLGDNYFRINPELPIDIELDDYKQINFLKNVAYKYDLTKANNFIKNVFLK